MASYNDKTQLRPAPVDHHDDDPSPQPTKRMKQDSPITATTSTTAPAPAPHSFSAVSLLRPPFHSPVTAALFGAKVGLRNERKRTAEVVPTTQHHNNNNMTNWSSPLAKQTASSPPWHYYEA
jgi:hypothetical protein